MNSIKFRGKDGVTDKWVYGDLLHICGGTLIYHGSQTESEQVPDQVINGRAIAISIYMDEISICYPNSVGQFTGWKDCTGTEIYEGDILSLSKAKEQVFEVYWNEHLCTFCLREYTRTTVFQGSCPLGEMLQISKPVVIIGNVFDNPELLKRKK
jgi:hypothetical protein